MQTEPDETLPVRREPRGNALTRQTASKTAAIPWPPPTHMVSSR
jgi:hypothetical protein